MNYEKQAINFLATCGIKFSVAYVGYMPHFAGEKESRRIYNCAFKRGNKGFSIKFGQSIEAGRTPPTAYDVLTCVQKYDVGSFEDFCSEFGYELWAENERTGRVAENKAAQKTYAAVCSEYEKVSNFFTDAEMELLQEMQ